MKGLRKVLFERVSALASCFALPRPSLDSGEAIGDTGLVVDQDTALFDELLQDPHLCALGSKRVEPFGVREQQLENELGVGGVVLGAAGAEGLAVLGQGCGVDGEQHQEVVLAKRGHDGALVEFEREGDGFALKALAQIPGSLIDALRAVLEHRLFALRGACGLHANVVLGLGPIESDGGGEVVAGWTLTFHMSPPEV